MERLIVDDRDKLLLDALASIHEQRCHEPIEVAVIYGAEHMLAALGHLRRSDSSCLFTPRVTEQRRSC
jgi:hypothetical protein